MAWLKDWWLTLFVASRTIRNLRNRIEELEQTVRMKELETVNYRRISEVAIDTVQAFGLHNRAIGMEAKVYAADIVERTTSKE